MQKNITVFIYMVSFFQVTNWVDPSFDGFSETTSISTITATSLSVNNASLRRKKVPSTLESSRNPASKGGNLSSSKQICGLDNSKEYLSENEPWVDKYKPETQVIISIQRSLHNLVSGGEGCAFLLLFIKTFLPKLIRKNNNF